RVDQIATSDHGVNGIITHNDIKYTAEAVVVCTGTFLNGRIHRGTNQETGGRSGDSATTKLAESLASFDFERGRLKTGTPPRVHGETVNFDAFEEQPGEQPPPFFSFFSEVEPTNQRSCWHSQTHEGTHDIIRDYLDRSPIYGTGVIDGTGVRYCPSVEDKVVQFEDKDSHQIILEPEGLHTGELYVNGLSTSLPPEAQQQMVRSIPGMEEAEISRWGYAIEYDFYQPTQLDSTLETRAVDGLYFAGQINGTTGYEEAAGQGIVAGINAGSDVLGKDPFILERTDAYTGVLVDDLVTQGTQEPYRMFTSRAEHRLCLRCDNAHYRLTPMARERGLISDSDWQQFSRERDAREEFRSQLEETRVKPGSDTEQDLEEQMDDDDLNLSETSDLDQLLKRPELDVDHVLEAGLICDTEPSRVADHVGIQIKYKGYIKRQQSKIEKARRMESKKLPDDLNYSEIDELSNESIEKLRNVRPSTLGQAKRISGIKPSDIQVLMVYVSDPSAREQSA
ncbi:MAG: tRNA uridine-5-carboxymethylaminomethyl(34) synthesis enzyme MnmG, partial [bacterium]